MASEAKAAVPERRWNLLLWAGMLAGPFAWALHQQVSYSLTQTLCLRGQQGFLHLVTVVALLICAGGALIAWRLWSQMPEVSTEHGDNRSSRIRFMALAGLVLCAFFALVIFAQEIPNWFLGPCVH
ncbi:MAG TPA: hypothetical protein VF756_03340 [Thermoanaerobaculia bacterium]